MDIISRPLDEIIPYEKNPRIISDETVDKVANSIREFGWRQPIVVDEDGVVIAGHTRLKAAQQLELETAPVHVAKGLSPEKVRAYRLADNRSGELADWDIGILGDELKALKMDMDLTDFGFRDIEIEMADIDELAVMEGVEEEPWTDDTIIRDGKPVDPDEQLSSGIQLYRLFVYFPDPDSRAAWAAEQLDPIPGVKTRTYPRDDIVAYWVPEEED